MNTNLKFKLPYHDLEQSKLIFSKDLKKWYLKNFRRLPWRCDKGDPNYQYKILVSEFMLQQTGVKTVIPYFERFITKWPDIKSLAKASENEILKYWQGLGYYSRGRNLLKSAKIICSDYNGIIPSNLDELLSLPGIGEYASAAIRSIAFDKKATVIDGNVKRVIARFFALSGRLKDNEKDISVLANYLTPNKGNANYSQAIMEFGALICRPRQSSCSECIVSHGCLSFKQGIVSEIPEAKVRTSKKNLRCASFLAIYKNNLVLIVKRKNEGLLKDMWQLPSSDWIDQNNKKKLVYQAPFKAKWSEKGKKN
jgi:A/G-specific adenine glycosylase